MGAAVDRAVPEPRPGRKGALQESAPHPGNGAVPSALWGLDTRRPLDGASEGTCRPQRAGSLGSSVPPSCPLPGGAPQRALRSRISPLGTSQWAPQASVGGGWREPLTQGRDQRGRSHHPRPCPPVAGGGGGGGDPQPKGRPQRGRPPPPSPPPRGGGGDQGQEVGGTTASRQNLRGQWFLSGPWGTFLQLRREPLPFGGSFLSFPVRPCAGGFRSAGLPPREREPQTPLPPAPTDTRGRSWERGKHPFPPDVPKPSSLARAFRTWHGRREWA